MNRFVFMPALFLLAAGIAGSETLRQPARKGTIVEHKIACYEETSIDYQRPRKPLLKVHLGKPRVVAVAPQPYKWGPYQFPVVSRWDDGTLCVKYHIAEDSVTAYGKPVASSVSTDGSVTWKPFEGKEGVSGLLLPNGDRIVITTPKAYKVSEITLPEPFAFGGATKATATWKAFRLADLPLEFRSVRISRLPKGSTEWVAEQADLIDPLAIRSTGSGYFPIIWWGDVRVAGDGSLIAGIYPGQMLKDDMTVDPKGHVFFYRSTDSGRTWTIQGRILYQPDMAADPVGDKRDGYTEPAFDILADGSLFCVSRTTDGHGVGPMYASHSQDLGKTWSKPVVLAMNGVLPRLLRLENGVEVLSSGRPGVQIRFSTDGKGKEWSDPFDIVPVTTENVGADTCGYTSLLATGPNRFLIAYTHFKHPTAEGDRKAILIREVQVDR